MLRCYSPDELEDFQCSDERKISLSKSLTFFKLPPTAPFSSTSLPIQNALTDIVRVRAGVFTTMNSRIIKINNVFSENNGVEKKNILRKLSSLRSHSSIKKRGPSCKDVPSRNWILLVGFHKRENEAETIEIPKDVHCSNTVEIIISTNSPGSIFPQGKLVLKRGIFVI